MKSLYLVNKKYYVLAKDMNEAIDIINEYFEIEKANGISKKYVYVIEEIQEFIQREEKR